MVGSDSTPGIGASDVHSAISSLHHGICTKRDQAHGHSREQPESVRPTCDRAERLSRIARLPGIGENRRPQQEHADHEKHRATAEESGNGRGVSDARCDV